jgi:hypothetical protein
VLSTKIIAVNIFNEDHGTSFWGSFCVAPKSVFLEGKNTYLQPYGWGKVREKLSLLGNFSPWGKNGDKYCPHDEDRGWLGKSVSLGEKVPPGGGSVSPRENPRENICPSIRLLENY